MSTGYDETDAGARQYVADTVSWHNNKFDQNHLYGEDG